jgi:hypothetical protein
MEEDRDRASHPRSTSMKQQKREYGPKSAKVGERTGSKCPLCGDDVLRQEAFSSNGTRLGYRQVCSKRGCPWKGRDQ